MPIGQFGVFGKGEMMATCALGDMSRKLSKASASTGKALFAVKAEFPFPSHQQQLEKVESAEAALRCFIGKIGRDLLSPLSC